MLLPGADHQVMGFLSRDESAAARPAAEATALDRIQAWTDAAEMDANEQTVRLLADTARSLSERPDVG